MICMKFNSLLFGGIPNLCCFAYHPASPYIGLALIIPPSQKLSMACSLSPNPSRSSTRSMRPSLLRSDVKRHTYTGKRTIQRSMISSPQGDVKHTGHVGLDGAYFGDISFLDPAGCVSCAFFSVDLENPGVRDFTVFKTFLTLNQHFGLF